MKVRSFLEMEDRDYERFEQRERDSYEIDYRRIVGDTEPAWPCPSNRAGDPCHPCMTYAHPTSHGHETAAQRYSATRIQAGYGPERSVFSTSTTILYLFEGQVLL